ncbi:hypothetical protein V6N13_005139 [Hibiscus sabdariffa]|uniref:Uncharacterized protein n=2 Tax=Hibiscus sabdariffa TaxID=183260 RepID=A0ABR2NHP9_9ROSI
MGGSTVVLPYASALREAATADVNVPTAPVLDVVPLQVVSPDTTIVPENKPVVVDHDDSALDSRDAANFETGATLFAIDAVSGPMHPVIAEFNEWFDANDDGADLVRRNPPLLSTKRAPGGSDPPRTKRARSIPTTVLVREAKHTKAGMSNYKHSLAKVDRQPRRGK